MRYTANQAATQTQSRDKMVLTSNERVQRLEKQGKSYRAENLRRTSLHIASESTGDRPAKYLSPGRISAL